MAKIKLGATVVGIRGTIGGITFSQNRAGPYARIWSRGTNPVAPLQQSQRQRLAEITPGWVALTAIQQAAWDTWAAEPAQQLIDVFGDPFTPSGYLWYSKVTLRLLAMGRPARVAPPVSSHPTAPTISSLELPYSAGQGAFVTYPSGTFATATDAILELAQANTVGRTVIPHPVLTVVQTQTPSDTTFGFPAQYAARFGAGSLPLKGFARLYRQTDDGLRSPPGSATYIESQGAAFVAAATAYDGINDWYLRAAGLDGITNTRVGIFSAWVRRDAAAGSTQILLSNSAARFDIRFNAADQVNLVLRDSAGVDIVNHAFTSTVPRDGAWHSLVASWDLDLARVQLAIDDALDTGPPAAVLSANDIDYDQLNWTVGSNSVGALLHDGCLSMLYFDQAVSLDLSLSSNRRPFIDAFGQPISFGPAGEYPLGFQPILAVPDGDPTTNIGTGGAFAAQGAQAACADAP